ncbi:unnamed protein product [Brassica oleracea var. botrytis]|uniref:Uncharacterized protein n=1 Tax=Brassica oleracea TaxID=3712 RepID=A0A3P6GBJ2_BRAOL|nr:unnamed protein product [Brassica oleracea]
MEAQCCKYRSYIFPCLSVGPSRSGFEKRGASCKSKRAKNFN